jgi:hypothetical protein
MSAADMLLRTARAEKEASMELHGESLGMKAALAKSLQFAVA